MPCARPTRKEFLAQCAQLATCGGLALAGWMLAACGRPTRSVQPGFGLNGASDAWPAEGRQPRIDPDFEPGYLALHRSGELRRRGEQLWQRMSRCQLCPRECGAARLAGARGTCGASADLRIASYHPHFGEERPLVGRFGSGTVFLSHCNLRCVFCINWPINHDGQGDRRHLDELATMMLRLQDQGCHNINVVTPTHYAAHVLLALDRAAERGLRLPLVYNTSGWERVDVLALLDGVVDIYLPDFKYFDPAMANRYSAGARSYPEVTSAAILEMHRQVGVAKPVPDGLMYRGLMIRHLVLPNDVSGTKGVLGWIAANLPRDTYVNLMSQYRPAHRAREYPALSRPLTRREFELAVAWTRESGLTRVDVQGE